MNELVRAEGIDYHAVAKGALYLYFERLQQRLAARRQGVPAPAPAAAD